MNTSFRKRLTVAAYLLLLMSFPVLEGLAAPSARYYTYDFSAAEGLSSNIVYSIIKGKDNNMWIATRQGIDRYDGFSFRHYSLFNDDLRLVGDGRKIQISYDGQNRLWAYTDAGQIFYYDVESDRFRPYLCTSDLGLSPLLNTVTQIRDKLYVCTMDGIYCFGVGSRRLISTGMKGNDVKCLKSYVTDRLIAGGSSGLYVLTEDLAVSEAVEATRNLRIECVHIDAESNRVILGCYGNGAWIYEKGAVTQIKGGVDNSIVRCITQYDDNTILLGCDGAGVYRMGRNGANLELFASDIVPQGVLSLKTSSVYSVLVDEGNIWVGSYRGGVTLFRKDSNFILVKDENEKVRSENFVHDACAGYGNDIWIAFNSRIGHYDFETQTLQKYLNGGFSSIVLDRYGFVWCGGYNTGVYRMNGETGVFQMIPSLSGRKEKDCVLSIETDQDGNVWVGGLNINLTRFTTNKTGYTTSQYNLQNVNSIVTANKDTLLLGTADGLRIINQNTGEISAPDITGPLNWSGTMFINTLAYDGNTCDVWIGTDGGGLVCYNLTDGRTETFTTHEGLPSNYIMGAEIDSMHRLWVSTENSGLFIFDTHTRKVISSIKRNDGLFFNEFFPGSSTSLPNGDLMFGGYGGAIIVPSFSMLDRTDVGNVSFTGLFVGPKPVSMKSDPHIISSPLNAVDRITLPYSNRSFALTISTDNLYYQHSVQLYWRLLGYSEGWQAIRHDRTIEVSNLVPGRYSLEIMKEQKDGEASLCRTVEIDVEQVIWLRWYCILLYLLAISFLVYWTIVSSRNRTEKRQFEDKVHFFINVAHDIKTPLMLISAPLAKLAKIQSEKPEDDERLRLVATANNNVKHLEVLVGQLMDFEKLSIGKSLPEAHVLDIGKYLELIKYDYQSMAEEKGLSFQMNAMPKSLMIKSDSSLLNRILDNLLSNAIKYTMEGGVTVNLRQEGNNAVVEVSDTGIGISKDSARKLFRVFYRGDNAVQMNIPGNGVGLFFTQALVKKMGGSLTFESTLGVGTSFFLRIPLYHEARKTTREEDDFSAIPAKTASFSSTRGTILIVDDNDELRDFLEDSLSGNYNILQSPSAEQSFDVLKRNSVDLIISDLLMPGMNGDEFCKHIKSHTETSHIPVILLTGVSDKDSIAQGLSVEADAYLTKPVDPDILYLKISNIFKSRQKLLSYFMSEMKVVSVKGTTMFESRPLQSDLDNALLQKVMKTIQDNMDNTEFSVNDLCRSVGVSRTLLYEKLRKLIGLAPNELIREMRLKQAKYWLEEGNMSVTEIGYQCGFSDVRYFSTVFKKYYGISPGSVRSKQVR